MSSSEPITLTKTERRILANQERILAKLEPGESDHHERLATNYNAGYQLEYSDALGHYDEVPASICREVLDIVRRAKAAIFSGCNSHPATSRSSRKQSERRRR